MLESSMLLWLALCSCSLLAVSAMIFAFALAKKLRLAQLQSETRLAHISSELAATEAGAMGVGERLMQLEQRLRKSKNRKKSAPRAPQPAADTTVLRDKSRDRFQLISEELIEPNYSQVERLLADDKSMAQVLDDCDVSQAEIELIAGLNQR